MKCKDKRGKTFLCGEGSCRAIAKRERTEDGGHIVSRAEKRRSKGALYSMDWIKGKPGGRGRQKDRTAVSQYLLCAPFPTAADRCTGKAPRNRGGGMDGREPSECGGDFRERLLVSERGGLFCRKRNFGQNSGTRKAQQYRRWMRFIRKF